MRQQLDYSEAYFKIKNNEPIYYYDAEYHEFIKVKDLFDFDMLINYDIFWSENEE